jgi:hypothetical protein
MVNSGSNVASGKCKSMERSKKRNRRDFEFTWPDHSWAGTLFVRKERLIGQRTLLCTVLFFFFNTSQNYRQRFDFLQPFPWMSARLKGCLYFIWFGHVFLRNLNFFYFKLIIFFIFKLFWWVSFKNIFLTIRYF